MLLPSGQRVKFADPHDAWLTNSGNLLLVDSGLDLVAEISPSGEALWALGGPTDNGTLRDPHRAVRTSFGHLLLADSTGILTLDKRGRVVNRTGTFVSDTGHAIRLTRPKALLDTPTTTIIADPRVGEHDLIGLIKARGVAYEVLNLDGGEQFPSASDICTLHQPRWLALSQEKRVVISDYSGHRLIETIPSPKTV